MARRISPSGETRLHFLPLISGRKLWSCRRRDRRQATVHRTAAFDFRVSPLIQKTGMAESHSRFLVQVARLELAASCSPIIWWNFFLTYSAPFWHYLLRKRCSLQLSSPLHPYIPILSMVKNVVNSNNSPKGNTFRGAVCFLWCGDCSLENENRQVTSAFKTALL